MEKTKLMYEEARVEVISIPLTDVITTSLAFDGEEQDITSW